MKRIDANAEKRILKMPFCEEDIRSLRAGDVIYISGTLVTARDDAHKRYVVNGVLPETKLSEGALYHAGPIVSKRDDGGYDLISCGPTTSMRMEKYEADFIEKSGVRLIIGKGGMGEKTAEACRRLGAVHCVFPGGCAVVAAKCVERIAGVEWLDLGMPEALWIFKIEEFGPLIVNIDTLGGDLIGKNREVFEERKQEQLEAMKEKLKAFH